MTRARAHLPLLLVLGFLGGLAGCRRVTIISFHPDGPPPQIDELVVKFSEFKGPLPLRGLNEEIGLYNLPGDRIGILAWGCFEKKIVLSNRGATQPYLIVADRVAVKLSADEDEKDSPCPMILEDGGVSGIPDSGAGGAAGMGEMGGATGSGGGEGGAGVGGANGCGGGGGAGGTTDAGAGGGAGAGGVTGTGGCDDAGTPPVDAGACTPPPDPPPTPSPVTPSAACVDYCNRIIGPRDGGGPLCPGSYPDVATCQRYCTLVAWAPGTMLDGADTMNCRLRQITAAEGQSGILRTMTCSVAGPGGSDSLTSCGSSCVTFCDAWAGICGGSAADCQSACASAHPVACRFNWLLRAASDPRYCESVSFSSICLVPGC